MEACGSSHFWARSFTAMGHEVKLISPQFVKPYVKTNKNDSADAAAIAEAVTRPHMRFVPVKQVWQHDLQGALRIRQSLIYMRTAITNSLHGLLGEYGLLLPKSHTKMKQLLAEVLSPEDSFLSETAKLPFRIIAEQWDELDRKIAQLDKILRTTAKSTPVAERLKTIPGVGDKTALAIVASVGDVSHFKNGRQFAAWIGLVPKHRGTGGKTYTLGISKRGQSELRSLLVQGGQSFLLCAVKRTDAFSTWAIKEKMTIGHNKAAVAIANKNARTIYALLKTGREYVER